MNTDEPNGSAKPPQQRSHPQAHADLSGDLYTAVQSLHRQFDEQVGAAAVEAEIQHVADRFTDARIRTYVPLFVRRFAGHELRGRSGTPRNTQLGTASS